MRTTKIFSVLFLFTIIFIFLILSCQKKEEDPLNGAWKMVSGSYTGPEFQVDCTEADRICYKLISDDHFAVVEICPTNPDSNLFTAVGKYNMTDSIYTETYEATNVSYKIGTSLSFNYKLEEENTLWIIDVKQEDMELHEVWQRVH